MICIEIKLSVVIFHLLDIDECADSSAHSCFEEANVVCNNTAGNYECVCTNNSYVATDSGGRKCQCEYNNCCINFFDFITRQKYQSIHCWECKYERFCKFVAREELWNNWTLWGACSASCQGLQTRTRTCKDTSAYYCTNNGGTEIGTQPCNTVACGEY